MSDEGKDKNLSKKQRGRISKYREQIRELHDEGYTSKEIQKETGAPQYTVSRELKKYLEEDPVNYHTVSESEEENAKAHQKTEHIEEKGIPRKKQADTIIDLIKGANIELFKDDYEVNSVRINRKKHNLESPFFRDWIVGEFVKSEGCTPSDNAINKAIAWCRYSISEKETIRKDENDEEKQHRKIDFSKLKDEDMKKSGIDAFTDMIESVVGASDEDREQAKELAILLDEREIKPFLDEDDFPSISIENKSYRIKESFVRDWMIGTYLKKHDRAITDNALDIVINCLIDEATSGENNEKIRAAYHEQTTIQFKRMTQLLRDEKIKPFRDEDEFIYIWVDGEKRKYDSEIVKTWMKKLLWNTDKRLFHDKAYTKIIESIKHDVQQEEAKKPIKQETEKEKPTKKKITQITHNIAQEAIDMHFIDELGTEYILVEDKTMIIQSKEASDWLMSKVYEKTGSIVTDAQIKQEKALWRHIARKQTIRLYNRVAPDEFGGIYINMADTHNQAIYLNKKGYSIKIAPTVFRPYKNKKTLPLPEEKGNIDDLFDYINIKDEDDKLLVKTLTIHYLIPQIDHICMYWYGGHGCGKSVGQLILRSLIDPSEADIQPIKKDMTEMDLLFEKNYLVVHDNISKISQEYSDYACQAITGTSTMRRKLYTDDETVVRRFWRSVFMNGRNMVAFNADFLDRFLIFQLSKIENESRMLKDDLKKSFGEKKGKLFGAMLDILVKAFNIYPKLKEEIYELPRMSDAVLYCCAITQAMEIDYHRFLDVYERKMLEQDLRIVRGSIIGIPLVNYIDRQPKINGVPDWSGDIQDLFIGIKSEAQIQSIDMRRFPRSSYTFSQRLANLEISLEKLGYLVERTEGGIRETIRIRRIREVKSIKDLKRENVLKQGYEKNNLDKYVETSDEIEDSTEESKPDSNMVDEIIDDPTEESKPDSNMVEGMKTFKMDVKKDEEKKTVAEKLEIVYYVISESQFITGVAKDETVFNILLEFYDIKRVEAEKLIKILMRDGRVFAPRIGYYKTT